MTRRKSTLADQMPTSGAESRKSKFNSLLAIVISLISPKYGIKIRNLEILNLNNSTEKIHFPGD